MTDTSALRQQTRLHTVRVPFDVDDSMQLSCVLLEEAVV